MKITGVKKAIGDYKSWMSRRYGNAANIMLDKSTGEVWTDVFTDCNSWIEYHSESIISLLSYIRQRTDEELSMQLLKTYAEMAIMEVAYI